MPPLFDAEAHMNEVCEKMGDADASSSMSKLTGGLGGLF